MGVPSTTWKILVKISFIEKEGSLYIKTEDLSNFSSYNSTTEILTINSVKLPDGYSIHSPVSFNSPQGVDWIFTPINNNGTSVKITLTIPKEFVTISGNTITYGPI